MSLPSFYLPDLAEQGERLTLSGAEGRHAVTVKRITPGEHIQLIDGTGLVVEAKVLSCTGKDQLQAEVLNRQQAPIITPQITVVQALPKSERSELAVDLATQAGADRIIPWEAERCIAKWQGAKRTKGPKKWEDAALASAKQSRRVRIPTIEEPHNTAQLCRFVEQSSALKLLLHEDATAGIASMPVQDAQEIILIVGPEGGIGEAECSQLKAAGAQLVALGPEVLRTASAAMVACAAIGVLARW